MVDGVVLLLSQGCVAGERVVRTMPVVLEFRRTFLEDLTAALWAEDVVAKAKVLV